MLVTDLVNVRYLTGFTGSNGACLCGPDGMRLFFTDFRYTERAAEPRSRAGRRSPSSGDWLGGIAERTEGKVGFEDDRWRSARLRETEGETRRGGRALSRRRHGRATCAGSRTPRSWRRSRPPPSSPTRSGLWSVERGFAGKTEREVARAAEARIRELGGEPSFQAIVAAGPNGAMPHAEPGERVIGRGELIVFDMGAKVDGYCSDGTRTYATGDPGAQAREVYGTVLAAQLAALEAVAPGAKGEDVDAVARKLIDDAGHAKHFGHGLGHGVGLEVHEGPRLSPRADDVLAPGEVVTVEPGIYLPGEFGVRIEDFVVVTEDGFRNLSTLPKELTIVD